MTDQDLREAFRAIRDKHDGRHPNEDATLRRVLLAMPRRERARRVTRWAVLPIAAVLVASTAWAGATGKLAPAMKVIMDALHAEDGERAPQTTQHAAAPTASTPASATAIAIATAAEPPLPEPAMAPAPTAATAPPRAAATPALAVSPARAPSPQPAPAPSFSPDPASALFAEAHRIHFVEREPARAIAAWDAYLRASPDGRFVPEARYNRALALVRLGRREEAERELDAFANGTYGTYRRDEARALLEALRSGSGP